MTWATDMLDRMKDGTHPAPPVVHTLKLGMLDDWGPGWARKTWRHDPAVIQTDGSMFGGYIAALFDQAMAHATMSVLAEDQAFRTANLNIQFVSLSKNENLIVEARVVAATSRVITLDAEIRSPDQELRSKASAQQIITRRQ